MHAGLPEQFRRLGVRLGESVSQSGIGDLEEHINITEDLFFFPLTEILHVFAHSYPKTV